MLWVRDDYRCFIAYDGVICNDTFITPLGQPPYVQSETPSVADPPIYAGASLFVVLLGLTLAVHWWRVQMADSGELYVPSPSAPVAAPAAADADGVQQKPPAEEYEPPSTLTARGVALGLLKRVRMPLSFLWLDWLQPG